MFIDASAIATPLGSEEDAGYCIAKVEGCSGTKAYFSITLFEAVITLARKETISRFDEKNPTPPEIIEAMQNDVNEFLRVIGAIEVSISGSIHKRALDAAKQFGHFLAFRKAQFR